MYNALYQKNVDLIEVLEENNKAIYLGNWKVARNVEYLRTHNIKFVLSAIPEYIAILNEYKKEKIVQKVINSNDSASFDIYSRLHEAADFIYESLKKGNLLIHCSAGISRSTTCLIAYYIKYRNMSFDDALALIKRNRPIVRPNFGFQKQLKKFEQELID